MRLKESGQQNLKQNKISKKFVYLISPNKIKNDIFYTDLASVLSTKKVRFFQLRLKKATFRQKFIIGKKILKICKKFKVKFLINDDVMLVKKLNADGCHLGQNDTCILEARKFIKNKIIGITCHNSLKLAKSAIKDNANYIAFGAFNPSNTKKVKYKANFGLIKKFKILSNIPVIAIGGINHLNYKKLLLNKADFLAISGYIWKNKKLKPFEAIKKLK